VPRRLLGGRISAKAALLLRAGRLVKYGDLMSGTGETGLRAIGVGAEIWSGAFREIAVVENDGDIFSARRFCQVPIEPCRYSTLNIRLGAPPR
jgi:hypothetical protein